MAVSPNQLRFVACGLPDNTAAILAAFLDDFQLDLKGLDERLDDFALNDAPGILAAIDEQVEIRRQLIEGGLIPELSTFEGLEETLKFISPGREEDEVAVSLDERSLGAVGLVCLHGKLFAKLNGNDLQAFRQLWLAVGGDYDSFLALGDGVAASLDGEFTLVQYDPKSPNFPYVNRTWEFLDSARAFARRSNYHQAVIWKSKILGNSSNNIKLTKLGWTSDELQQIFSRNQPVPNNLKNILLASVGEIKALASLVLKPINDPARAPAWTNESAILERAVRGFLDYRFARDKSSYVFNVDLWERLKASLSSRNMKELFENRPEITNMLMPTDEVTLGDLLTKATQLPADSPMINTYMLGLPSNSRDTLYARSLLIAGAKVLRRMQQISHPRVSLIASLLAELKGGPLTSDDYDASAPSFNINDMKEVLNVGKDLTQPSDQLDETGLPLEGSGSGTQQDQTDSKLLGGVNKALNDSYDPDLAGGCLAAASDGDKANREKNKKTASGFQTSGNASGVLFRRVRWQETLVHCGKTVTVQKEGLVPQTDSTNITGESDTVGEAIVEATAPTIRDEVRDNLRERVKKNVSNSAAAKNRTKVARPQPVPKRSFRPEFEYACEPSVQFGFNKKLRDLGNAGLRELLVIVRMLKEMLLAVQDLIDSFIIKIQVTLDVILGRLERLLTFDFNIGGSLGFDSSLIKCSWNLDFGIKIDLFGILLQFLNAMFDKIAKPLRAALQLLQDFITKVICIPVRLIESFVGGVNSLLGLIGCSLKDIKLPKEILDLLKMLIFTFDLRSLVLQKGYDAILSATFGLKKHRNSFNGLTQFAAICQKVTTRDALNAVDSVLLATLVTAPTKATDALAKASDVLKQQAVSQAFAL